MFDGGFFVALETQCGHKRFGLTQSARENGGKSFLREGYGVKEITSLRADELIRTRCQLPPSPTLTSLASSSVTVNAFNPRWLKFCRRVYAACAASFAELAGADETSDTDFFKSSSVGAVA